MLDFVEGRYDVLCATAIIESGLDIPRANTILIDRADMFGLAQLYQLRGRVGRARERAYCYLIVPPANAMTDEARARIEALERHTELGAGFQIASLDLELRGVGRSARRGAERDGRPRRASRCSARCSTRRCTSCAASPCVHDVDPELSFDADALLPGGLRGGRRRAPLALQAPRAAPRAPRRCTTSRARWRTASARRPPEARRFVHLMRLKTELRRLKALGCEATSKSVTLHLRDDTPLDPAKLMKLMAGKQSPYKLSPDMRLTRKSKEAEAFTSGLEAADKVLADLAGCLRDSE